MTTNRPEWHEANSGTHQGLITDVATGRTVAVSYAKEDARLIAAAPELLHSLEQTVASLTYWFGRYDDPEGAMSLMMNRARAAIAKAKGE